MTWQLKNQIAAGMKSTAIPRLTNCREFLIRSERSWKSTCYIASVFKAVQACSVRIGSPEIFTSHPPNAVCCDHEAFAAFAPIQAVRNILVLMLHRCGLHACIACRNNIVTYSNKLWHIVTLRDNAPSLVTGWTRQVCQDECVAGVARNAV